MLGRRKTKRVIYSCRAVLKYGWRSAEPASKIYAPEVIEAKNIRFRLRCLLANGFKKRILKRKYMYVFQSLSSLLV